MNNHRGHREETDKYILIFLGALCALCDKSAFRIQSVKTMQILISSIAALFAILALGFTASAENVDLSTVPKRDSVQLTIYNSEDITLVRETRAVTFKKGLNPLQFSWANTLIDPSSVELRFLTATDKLDVEDTTFPHDKPQMLYWNVKSEIDGEATIQITYFTSGITWSADYIAIADKDESTLKIDGFVRLTNNSGEQYDDAQVRLVVGTINLVEKIAQLANVPMSEVSSLPAEGQDRFRREAVSRAMGRASGGAMAPPAAPAPAPAEKEIIKEGLSEYFIYSIEGTETIPNGWSKRMRSFDGQSVPIKVQYRYRPREYGEQLVRMYLTTNNKESKLGTTPLPDGTFRVFRNNGRDGLSYLTQQQVKYIPIGDKIELNLGVDPEVVFKLEKLRTTRDNLVMKINNVDKYQKVGDDAVEREYNSAVAGWDDHTLFRQQIRNNTAKPIDVEIRRSFDGHTVFRSQLEPMQFDFQTAQFTTKIAPSAKKDLLYKIVTHQGRNKKQDNLTLETAEVENQGK